MNPIFQYVFYFEEPRSVSLPNEPDHLWYFWDETWADTIGPYQSRTEASKKLNEYALWLDGKAAGIF